MKTENMTFSEAYETMKQGYEVDRKNPNWGLLKLNSHSLKLNEEGLIVDNKNEPIIHLPINDVLATDWRIYTKPEPKFEIGELVMMRDSKRDIWVPQFFSRYYKDECVYMAISISYVYKQCAKFDKDIVFTNKPAKK